MHVFPPLLGWVQATQAELVLGKTEGMVDGWCWGWRGGVADYWGTKNDKRRRRKSCLWTGLIHRGEEGTKSGYKKTKRGIKILACGLGLRGHGDSQTVVFFLPKLRPAIFTIKKFCATTLTFTSASPLK